MAHESVLMRQTELHLTGADRQGGVDLAVFDVARPGRPPQYDTDAETRVTALACSAPPDGRQRWTLVELEHAARQESGLATVSQRPHAA